jgi:hypothetical protein
MALKHFYHVLDSFVSGLLRNFVENRIDPGRSRERLKISWQEDEINHRRFVGSVAKESDLLAVGAAF